MVKKSVGAVSKTAPKKKTTGKQAPITINRQDKETATYVRTSAYNNGGTFDNPDLLWYAKGVRLMMSRALDDPNSWWFFAAIHGEAIGETTFPGWGTIPSPPQVPTTPLPSADVMQKYWNQCQHQTWFFPPWHRGYLVALEAQIRAAIVSLGGPSTWALPYWNYFGPDAQYEIPPAFTQTTLPDGSPNPLYVAARYGPSGDGNVYVEIPPASQACERNDVYTGRSPTTTPPGFGGPATGFSHFGRVSGNLESNPHNLVHVDVGGPDGLMSYPDSAALDPIFYLHHANIDRMWAAWNANGNANPTDPNWLNGPAATGQQEFVMPMPDGTSWAFTPADVDSLSEMDYTYDNLALGGPVRSADRLLGQRLKRLGAAATTAVARAGAGMGKKKDDSELVGTRDGALPVTGTGARATVRLDPDVQRKVVASLAAASPKSPPDRVYLRLEDVRGARDAHKLTVYVNQHLAGTVALFGIRRASQKDGKHGGEGLTFVLDITDVIDALHLDGALDASTLDVRIVPNRAIAEDADIRVGRVSVYRQGHP